MKNIIEIMIKIGAKEASIKNGKISFFVNGNYAKSTRCDLKPVGRFYSTSGEEINREEWKALRKEGALSINELIPGEYSLTLRGSMFK